MEVSHLSTKHHVSFIESRLMSEINDCADDCALTIKENQTDCDFCSIRTQCLDYWDNFIAHRSNFSMSTHLRHLDSFRRQKLISALILVLTLIKRAYIAEYYERRNRNG